MTDPSMTDPSTDPATTDPAMTGPAMTGPATTGQATGPAIGDPAAGHPSAGGPSAPDQEPDRAAVRRVVTVGSSVGLHARPASLFSQAAARTGHPVQLITTSGRSVNAASILGILSLGIDHGEAVTLSATGEDAGVVLDELAALLASDLDQQ